MSDRINEIMNKLKEENKVLPVTTDCIFKDIFKDEEMKGVLHF